MGKDCIFKKKKKKLVCKKINKSSHGTLLAQKIDDKKRTVMFHSKIVFAVFEVRHVCFIV